MSSGVASPKQSINELPSANEDSKRQQSTVLRIVRDTKLSRELKKLYDYTCQVCGLRIEVKGIGYAEAAHIKPLGKPHNGHDKGDNLLCLCPNHHVMLDKGIIALSDEFEVLGAIHEKLIFKAGHDIIRKIFVTIAHLFISISEYTYWRY